MIRDGELVELSGADAGRDLLCLAHRCRRLLTDNRQPPRHMAGVHRDCGFAELYERLDEDGQPAGSECHACRTSYGAQGYADLTSARKEPVKTYRRALVAARAGDDITSRRV
ncbi:hypothetical protein GCM10010486_52780 [Nonomuraea roseoviolacea subsp. carminata]